MRVTNGMIRNTTLNGLYNNMSQLNKTYAQMTTGKKIQTVSDDPIIAGRGLKLTTTVLETEQYKSNVKEAQSWTNVTNASLNNIMDILKNDIRTKCVQGATGTVNTENKQSIRTQIEELWRQIQVESNGTYGGRYVFSGYKTSEPVTLTQDYKVKNSDMKIKEDIYLGSTSEIKKDSVLEDGSKISKGSILGKDTSIEKVVSLGNGTELSKDDGDALLGITYVGGKCQFDTQKTIKANTIVTEKEAQELNQLIVDGKATGEKIVPTEEGKYILTEDIKIGANTPVSNELSKSLIGVGVKVSDGNTSIVVTKQQTELKNANNYKFQEKVKIGSGSDFEGKITLGDETTLEANSVLKKASTIKIDSTLGKGTLNPEVIGKISNQHINYEIGTNSTIDVNVNELDGIMVEIAECLNEIFLELDEAIDDETITSDKLNQMFTRKLDEIDNILSNITEVTSDLGSRINRLTYTLSRLDEQNLTFKELLSSTEDVDIEKVYTNFNIQYATYQSALQATSKIITNTLADYL